MVDYIRENEEMFQPFVEDEEPFPRYVSRMVKVTAEADCRLRLEWAEASSCSLLLKLRIKA